MKTAEHTTIDPLKLFWIGLISSIVPVGIYLLIGGNKQIADFYVYGKSLDLSRKKSFFWKLFLVPKRYFRHFYVLSLLIFATCLALVVMISVPSRSSQELEVKFNYFSKHYKSVFKIETSNSLEFTSSLIFTIVLMMIQSSRRLYESLFVSVYSSQSKINIIHYLFGHAFYIAAATSTLCPIIMSPKESKHDIITLLDNLVDRKRAILFVLFMYTSHYQHICHKILANLRKDKTGGVIAEQHFVPSGGPFEYVSCPHFLTEVLIYLLIVTIQKFESTYWNLIFLLVLSTQTINALTEHKWYKRKYKDYPKSRKAIFPKLL